MIKLLISLKNRLHVGHCFWFYPGFYQSWPITSVSHTHGNINDCPRYQSSVIICLPVRPKYEGLYPFNYRISLAFIETMSWRWCDSLILSPLYHRNVGSTHSTESHSTAYSIWSAFQQHIQRTWTRSSGFTFSHTLSENCFLLRVVYHGCLSWLIMIIRGHL